VEVNEKSSKNIRSTQIGNQLDQAKHSNSYIILLLLKHKKQCGSSKGSDLVVQDHQEAGIAIKKIWHVATLKHEQTKQKLM
jgi:hypothetical protein